MTTPEFDGRTALVTGGGRGIGRACCLKLAQAGAAVAVNYASRADAAAETVREIQAAGGRAVALQADVSDADQVDQLVRRTQEELGPIDLLVNNAGIFEHTPHTELPAELWNRTLAVNLTGPYLVSWAVKDGMLARGWGRIVNMSSISGLRARPMSIAYAASKAGLIGLTRSLAEALAPGNVRVNAVAPGLIDTEIIADVEQSRLDEIVESTPIRRLGQPAEIADTVMFLLSDASSFTTGQTLVASGGRVMLP